MKLRVGIYRHMFHLKQPAVARTPEPGKMATDVDWWGRLFTGKEHACSATGQEHAASDNVPEEIAIRSGQNNMRESDFKRAAESVQRLGEKTSSRLSEETLSLPKAMALPASDYQEHLFTLRACQNLYDTGVQDKLVSPQMKAVSVLCDTRDGSEEQNVFSMNDLEAVMMIQLRFTAKGYLQMRRIMQHQTGTASISRESKEHAVSTEHTSSV